MSQISLFLLTASLFYFTLLSGQELLFFYSQGSAFGTTPYVQISVDGKNIGTISLMNTPLVFHGISVSQHCLGRRGLQGVEF